MKKKKRRTVCERKSRADNAEVTARLISVECRRHAAVEKRRPVVVRTADSRVRVTQAEANPEQVV